MFLAAATGSTTKIEAVLLDIRQILSAGYQVTYFAVVSDLVQRSKRDFMHAPSLVSSNRD